MNPAKNNGVTRSGTAAIITRAAFYAGRPMGWSVLNPAFEIPGEGTSNEWCEPVSGGEYRALK